jgi:hypothetical protein
MDLAQFKLKKPITNGPVVAAYMIYDTGIREQLLVIMKWITMFFNTFVYPRSFGMHRPIIQEVMEYYQIRLELRYKFWNIPNKAGIEIQVLEYTE